MDSSIAIACIGMLCGALGTSLPNGNHIYQSIERDRKNQPLFRKVCDRVSVYPCLASLFELVELKLARASMDCRPGVLRWLTAAQMCAWGQGRPIFAVWLAKI